MAFYRSQVIFPFFTNLPTDVFVNQMHWFSNDTLTDEEVCTEVRIRLSAFYVAIYGSAATNRVNYIDWPQCVVKLFNLGDAPPRVPEIQPITWTTGTNASPIPTEVACVASFHAAPASGVRYQRLQNRIFLGGIPSNAIGTSLADQFPRFTAAWTGAVNTAMESLLAENDGIVDWRQYSQATGTPTFRTITGGWCDNSPDSQRRRSVLASVREIWP